MWRFLVNVVVLAGIILGLGHILPGLYVPNFIDALIFSFVVALINSFITPILIVISYPITVMTVGLFAVLINIFTFWMASLISYGIHITSFWGAFWGGIIVIVSSFILNFLLSKEGPIARWNYQRRNKRK